MTEVARPNKPVEIVSLTSIRGCLAIWVVIYHFWNDVLLLFPATSLLTPVIRLGNLAVPAFFMLSGYVLAYNYSRRFHRLETREVIRFYALRLARIYPVHFATLMAVVAMVAVGQRYHVDLSPKGYLVSDFFLNIFLVQTWVPNFELNWNYPSWSISSEWFAYLIFPWLICSLSRWNWNRWKALALAVGTLGCAVAVTSRGHALPFYELILVIPNFVFGIAVYFCLCTISLPERVPPVLRFVPEILVVLSIAACFLPWGRVAVTLVLIFLGGLVFSLALLRERCHEVWNWHAAWFLGEISYSLYMTHTLVQKLVNTVLPASRFHDSPWSTKVLVLSAYVVCIIGFCILSYVFVENPARRYGKQLALRLTA